MGKSRETDSSFEPDSRLVKGFDVKPAVPATTEPLQLVQDGAAELVVVVRQNITEIQQQLAESMVEEPQPEKERDELNSPKKKSNLKKILQLFKKPPLIHLII